MSKVVPKNRWFLSELVSKRYKSQPYNACGCGGDQMEYLSCEDCMMLQWGELKTFDQDSVLFIVGGEYVQSTHLHGTWLAADLIARKLQITKNWKVHDASVGRNENTWSGLYTFRFYLIWSFLAIRSTANQVLCKWVDCTYSPPTMKGTESWSSNFISSHWSIMQSSQLKYSIWSNEAHAASPPHPHAF